MAPRAQRLVSLVLFACGASLTWLVASPWHFPEGHARAYQPSWVPLALTLAGGLVGLAIAWMRTLRAPGLPEGELSSTPAP